MRDFDPMWMENEPAYWDDLDPQGKQAEADVIAERERRRQEQEDVDAVWDALMNNPNGQAIDDTEA